MSFCRICAWNLSRHKLIGPIITRHKLFCRRSLATKSKPASSLLVFDRDLKRRQRNWAASQPDFNVYQYLKEEAAYRTADKIYDCTDFFPVAVEIGSGAGWLAPHAFKQNVGCLVQMEMSEGLSSRAQTSDEVPCYRLIADEEKPPFHSNSVDLFVSSLSGHWINNLPQLLMKCYDSLRPDGAFIMVILGGQTLFELRCSLQLAETERLGGMAQHMSPLIQAQDLSALMSRAGFQMLTLDVDQIVVNYPHMTALMHDLQGMAENSALINRATHLRRDVLIAAEAIYQCMYGSDDKERGSSVPATFQLFSIIGWKPGPKMAKPIARGSQTASFKDLEKVVNQPIQSK